MKNNISKIYRAMHGLPWWLSGKQFTCQCRRHRFDPWVRKMPWRRKWPHTPVFLPGKSYEQRRPVGYSPWGCKRVGHNLATQQQSNAPKSGWLTDVIEQMKQTQQRYIDTTINADETKW